MNPLIFTIALNGYDSAYRDCLRSQVAYCRSQGFTHVVVRRPFRVSEVALTAWLKISLMERALSAGTPWVAFIDADARIQTGAPDFRTVEDGDHSVYAAKGRSGRWNSGVIFARPHDDSRSFFSEVLRSARLPIPDEDRKNLRFENGNFITTARQTHAVGEIDLTWNNTYEASLNDHVRHFTGPLRAEYRASKMDAWIYQNRQRLIAPPTAQPQSRDAGFLDRLAILTDHVVRRYPSIVNR